jgi:TonB family protein
VAVPEKPPVSHEGCVEADVEVLVFIDQKGSVTMVKILQESSCAEFNEMARRAAFAQRWTPATRDGQSIASTKKYTYRFRLEPESEKGL